MLTARDGFERPSAGWPFQEGMSFTTAAFIENLCMLPDSEQIRIVQRQNAAGQT